MRYRMFTIFDSKSEIWGLPYFMPTVASARRQFGDMASDIKSVISKHPSDYLLFEVGVFDESSGKLVSVEPVAHGSAQSLCVPDFIPTQVAVLK